MIVLLHQLNTKSLYNDVDIVAGENIMFSIKIIPFGKINTLSLN